MECVNNVVKSLRQSNTYFFTAPRHNSFGGLLLSIGKEWPVLLILLKAGGWNMGKQEMLRNCIIDMKSQPIFCGEPGKLEMC